MSGHRPLNEGVGEREEEREGGKEREQYLVRRLFLQRAVSARVELREQTVTRRRRVLPTGIVVGLVLPPPDG